MATLAYTRHVSNLEDVAVTASVVAIETMMTIVVIVVVHDVMFVITMSISTASITHECQAIETCSQTGTIFYEHNLSGITSPCLWNSPMNVNTVCGTIA